MSEKLEFDNLQGEREYGRVGHQVRVMCRGGSGAACCGSVELLYSTGCVYQPWCALPCCCLQAYSQSKLALNMWSFMLAAKLHKAHHPAVVHCIDPGAAATKVPGQQLELRVEHQHQGCCCGASN